MKIAIRKGAPWIVLLYIVAIIILGVAYSVLMEPARVVYDASYVHENVQDDVYQDFFTKSRTVFLWLPLLLIVPIILWMIIKAHEKNTGY